MTIPDSISDDSTVRPPEFHVNINAPLFIMTNNPETTVI
jgi:hypothetical protein